MNLRDDGMAVVQDDGPGWGNSEQGRDAPKGFRFDLIENFADVTSQKRWLIKGIVARGETSAWVGPPGSLKSALMAELAFCAANQIDWHGKKTKACFGVLYFALERADLVRRRLSAHWKRHGFTSESDISSIAVVPAMVDLMNPATVSKVVDTIKSAAACFRQPVELVIFDTFAKLVAAGGGDEDKAKDQGKVFANIQRVKDLIGRGGPHVALVGHTGKDETRGSRGSNAILGDADVMVTISGAEIKTATVTKANDAPEGPLFSFKSETHDFGPDEDGDPITVNIVSSETPAAPAEVSRGPKLKPNQQTVFAILHGAGSAGLSLEDWNTQAKDAGIGLKRKADLTDIRNALQSKGLVRNYGDRWRVSHD